jgi:hypothetical protein
VTLRVPTLRVVVANQLRLTSDETGAMIDRVMAGVTKDDSGRTCALLNSFGRAGADSSVGVSYR